MKKQGLSTFYIFFYPSNKRALVWSKKINSFLKNRFPSTKSDSKTPNVVIVLGGDGTILEAARKYHESGSVILGLNLGHVGFLASVRAEHEFLKSLDKFFRGNYKTIERMMIKAQVKRKGKIIFKAEALNEVVVKSPLGMVELEARIAGHPVKYIQGTGILVSTATGSTAYSLSAHGPIVMPDIKCFIITEVLDHSIPSPSLVVKYINTVNIKVTSFRKRGIISLSKSNKKIDVLLIADGESFFPLEEKDEVVIESSPHLVKFAELEKNYFFKSLKEKFGFR
ncbi:MAG: NAD(+)/NADH kinase [bacterium]|nr:NAD(+)/NADH kinase [bacterium]